MDSPLARGGRYFWRCVLGAVGVDRVHDQGRLHAHHGAVAGIDALDLAGNQAVADVIDAGAAVALDRRTEEPELAHLAEDRRVRLLVAEGIADAGREAVLRVGAGALGDHALLIRKLRVQLEGILPVHAAPALARRRAALDCGHRVLPRACIQV
jgi:hypothetical protein